MTIKKRNNTKFDVSVNGVKAKWSKIERVLDHKGAGPSDSENINRYVYDYIAYIVDQVNNASQSQLRNFDSELIRTSDGYGGHDWKILDDYNPNVIQAYQPLVDYITGKSANEFFDNGAGITRFKDNYFVQITDSDGASSFISVYTLFKMHFSDFINFDYLARTELGGQMLQSFREDSELAAGILSIINTENSGATGAFQLPVGKTIERPLSPGTGMFRYNDDIGELEFYDSDGWQLVKEGLSDQDRDTYIDAESTPGADEDRLRFVTAGDERMIINSTGNVGIGNAGSTLTAKLSVDNDVNGTEAIRIGSSTGGGGGVTGKTYLGLSAFSSGTAQTYPHAQIGVVEFDAADYRGALVFETRASDTDVAPTERMRIDSAGRVGIGTNNPSRELDIKLNDDTTTTLGQKGGINFYAPSNTVGNGGELTWSSAVNGEVWAAISGSIFANNAGVASGHLTFATGNASALPTERMRINSSGNVGIGTTAPNTPLHIEGDDDVAVRIQATGADSLSRLLLQNDEQTWTIDNDGADGNALTFYDATALLERMRITTTGEVEIAGLAGTGDRVVTASATGVLAVATVLDGGNGTNSDF